VKKKEQSPIGKAIVSVKNSFHQFTATSKKKEEAEEKDRDGIVVYRGMKMTVA
jgi:hypothetical protein